MANRFYLNFQVMKNFGGSSNFEKKNQFGMLNF